MLFPTRLITHHEIRVTLADDYFDFPASSGTEEGGTFLSVMFVGEVTHDVLVDFSGFFIDPKLSDPGHNFLWTSKV